MFVGKYDPAKLRLADKLVTALPASPLHGLPARDDRDWPPFAPGPTEWPPASAPGNGSICLSRSHLGATSPRMRA